MISVAVHGAAGRMGQRIIALCLEDDQLRLAGAVERKGHPLLGQDAGSVAGADSVGVAIEDRVSSKVDVVIDFTIPAASRVALKGCVDMGIAMVLGTTGLTDQDNQAIDEAAQTIAVLQAPNMSLGVNLLFALAAQVAGRLGDDYDIEITEAHHRYKKDAPSGTAWGLAQAICQATGKNVANDVIHGRHGQEVPRQRGQIGMHSLRMGDVVGEHSAKFAGLGERLELTHIATDRDVFVRGAIKAAKWLAGKKPGRYSMSDVLGLPQDIH